MKSWAAFGALLLGAAPSAQAVDVVFSTRPAFTEPAGQNPVIYANVGAPVRLWLLARRSGDVGYVQTMSLSIRAQAENGGAIFGPGVGVDNPGTYIGGDPSLGSSYITRWDTTLNGTPESGGLAVRNSTGLSSSFRPGLSIDGEWTVFGSLDLYVAHEGTVRFYLQVGTYGIAESGDGATTSRFGWAAGGGELDGPVSNVAGAESGFWDATVIAPIPPIPEPGTVGLIGVIGLRVISDRPRQRSPKGR